MLVGLHERIDAGEKELLLQVSEARRVEPVLREYVTDRAAVQATLERTEMIIDDIEHQLRLRCPQVFHVTIEVQGIADQGPSTESPVAISDPFNHPKENL